MEKADKTSIWKTLYKHRFAYYFILPTVIGMFILHLLPIVQGIYMSFLRLNQFTINQYLSAPFVFMQNYWTILFDAESPIRIGLLDAVRNTIIYTVFVTCGTLVLGTIVALMLNRRFRGRALARTLFLFPWIVPTYVTGLLWGFMWQRGMGIINIFMYDVLHFHLIAAKINPILHILGVSFLIQKFDDLLMWSWSGFNYVSTHASLGVNIGLFILTFVILFFSYFYFEKRHSAQVGGLIFITLATYLFLMVFKIQLPVEINAEYKPFWLLGTNTIWAIIIPTVWRYWPLSMLMLLAGLQTIPDELYEAADIDGASPWRKFWMITWPLLKPVWAILILFGLIYNVYSFNIVIMMFGFGAGFPGEWGDLMMTNIFRNSFMQWNFGAGAAASVLLMLVMVVIVNFWLRFYKSSEEYR
ncbi:MAG: sugar ABC transporter permease [Candidatus Margulisiibacteriota bacterium]